jgi:phosphoribosylanthranilate isomerase
MTKIKICGLKRPEDIDAANRYLPDYIGYVFAQSKRQVDDVRAAELKLRLNPRISAVGVFVNENIDRIVTLCRMGVIDLVQLHGDEDDSYIRSLKHRISNPVIKAVRVRNRQSLDPYCSCGSDFLLLDTYHSNMYGGSGEAFDWSLVERPDKPFFLAGGLHKENVLQAMELLHPYCVDISSGVEKDGVKDPVMIGEIITKIREYENRRMQ